MKPPPFKYVRAGSVDEALASLTEHGEDARALAGGQSLIAMMNLRLVRPQVLVDINRVGDLAGVSRRNGTVVIGATTRQSDVESSAEVARACPLVTEAIGHVAHRAIRNRGTLGGNLAQADPSSELPAVAVVLGAEMVARGRGGERVIPAEAFFTGYLSTALSGEELLVEIRVPAQPAGNGYAFEELSPRKGDYALAAVAVTLDVEGGTCTAARLAYAGVGDHAHRVEAAEQALVGQPAGDAAFAAAADAASRAVEPGSDVHASAAYKRDLVNTLTRRALVRAYARAAGEG